MRQNSPVLLSKLSIERMGAGMGHSSSFSRVVLGAGEE